MQWQLRKEEIQKEKVLINANILFKEFNREHEYCSKYKPTNFC